MLAPVTIRRGVARWVVRVWAALGVVYVLLAVAQVAWTLAAGRLTVWSVLTMIFPFAIVASQVLVQRGVVRRVTVSVGGLRWSGLLWSRERSWADLGTVGTVHLPGAGPRSIAAVLPADAAAPSGSTPPLPMEPAGFDAVTVLMLIPLTGRYDKPAWDVSDEDVVQAVRARAGDRWVDELTPPAR